MEVTDQASKLFQRMETSKQAFVAVDYDHTFIYLNAVAEAFYGRSKEELVGRKVKDVFPEAWDFGPFKNGRVKADQRLPFELEYNSPFAKRWVQLKGKPYDEFYTYTYFTIDQKTSLQTQLRNWLNRSK